MSNYAKEDLTVMLVESIQLLKEYKQQNDMIMDQLDKVRAEAAFAVREMQRFKEQVIETKALIPKIVESEINKQLEKKAIKKKRGLFSFKK